MHVIKSVKSLLSFRDSVSAKSSLGLVPTMGALHMGHGHLVSKSVAQNDITIVSIFVNPTQFGPNEDFSTYPRMMEADIDLLSSLGVQHVFIPDIAEIYPSSTHQISFSIGDFSGKLDAKSRPGHMEGVLQIVSILFHLIAPTKAYFGEKDYQQLLLIRKLVQELFMPIEIVPCPIVRESDGLAMSSRNRHLKLQERNQAIFLYKTLLSVKAQWSQFNHEKEVRMFVEQEKKAYPLVSIDYFHIFDADSLEAPTKLQDTSNLRAFMAAVVGNTRLIDNLQLT